MKPAIEIPERLAKVRENLAMAARRAGRDPASIRLVAVSKGAEAAGIEAAARAGQHEFAENYVQAAVTKMAAINCPGLRWHLVGQLQSNKAAKAARHFSMIQSLASLSAAQAISRAMQQDGSCCRVLLQVHLGGGAARGGVEPQRLCRFAEQVTALPGLLVDGVMGIAPVGEPARPHFVRLRSLLEKLGGLGLANAPLTELSAGMSADYEEAVCEGATIVRIGSAIFGDRAQRAERGSKQ